MKQTSILCLVRTCNNRVKTNELENIKMGNKQSTTVTKCGLSPDETKELITSKVNELVQRHVDFIQVDVLIPMLQAINDSSC
jgi:hypothetical protein